MRYVIGLMGFLLACSPEGTTQRAADGSVDANTLDRAVGDGSTVDAAPGDAAPGDAAPVDAAEVAADLAFLDGATPDVGTDAAPPSPDMGACVVVRLDAAAAGRPDGTAVVPIPGSLGAEACESGTLVAFRASRAGDHVFYLPGGGLRWGGTCPPQGDFCTPDFEHIRLAAGEEVFLEAFAPEATELVLVPPAAEGVSCDQGRRPCEAGTFCPAGPDQVCQAPSPPVVQAASALRVPRGVAVTARGVDPSRDVTGLRVQSLDEAGEPVDDERALVAVVGRQGDEFQAQVIAPLPDGARLRIVVEDAAGLVSAPIEAAILDPAILAPDAPCDSRDFEFRCPDGQACIARGGGERCRPLSFEAARGAQSIRFRLAGEVPRPASIFDITFDYLAADGRVILENLVTFSGSFRGPDLDWRGDLPPHPEDPPAQIRVRLSYLQASITAPVGMLIPRAQGEACDPDGLLDECTDRLVCGPDGCGAPSPPVLVQGHVYLGRRSIGVRLEVQDPNGDANQAQLHFYGPGVDLGFGRIRLVSQPDDPTSFLGETSLIPLDQATLAQVARVEVTLTDAAFAFVDAGILLPEPAPILGQGQACDIAEGLSVCGDGMLCPNEPEPVCTAAQEACAADQPVEVLAEGVPMPFEPGGLDRLAPERCQAAPDRAERLFRFVAARAGTWRAEATTGPGAPPTVYARTFCQPANQVQFDDCNEQIDFHGGHTAIHVALEAGESVLVVVESDVPGVIEVREVP